MRDRATPGKSKICGIEVAEITIWWPCLPDGIAVAGLRSPAERRRSKMEKVKNAQDVTSLFYKFEYSV